MLILMWFSGFFIGFGIAALMVQYQFKTGWWVCPQDKK